MVPQEKGKRDPHPSYCQKQTEQMSEKSLHRAVCDYIRLQYPSVLFNSDLAGSMRLTIGQAVAIKALRSGRGFPDIAIYEPRGKWHGLFLELKKEGEQVINKKGFPSTPHIAEQFLIIERLRLKDYCAGFAVGFDDAKKQIDNYIKTT
jgi:hypothetical protein